MLDAESVEAIAVRVVQLLTTAQPSRSQTSACDPARLVDARTLAIEIGMSATWVREHAGDLGGQRMTDGPRGRLRFDPDEARARLASRSASEQSAGASQATAEAKSKPVNDPSLGSR